MTGTDVDVRRIRPDEVEAAIGVWLEANDARGVATPELHREIVRRQLSAECDTAFVCVDGAGTLLGFVTGAPRRIDGTDDPGATELLSIFVSPEAQGRGVGSRLLDALLADAEGRARPQVHLWVRTNNSGARRLYERVGFRAAGEPVMDGDVPITQYVRSSPPEGVPG